MGKLTKSVTVRGIQFDKNNNPKWRPIEIRVTKEDSVFSISIGSADGNIYTIAASEVLALIKKVDFEPKQMDMDIRK